ncbi:MAG: recombination mediator RecR [Oscillospiraceae bacterium]|nr:recombination mediator RecR [Oscillospiraceae bacterium]
MSSTVPSLVKLIEQFEKLPGIGRKSAQRMAFFMLSQPLERAEEFANAVVTAHKSIRRCGVCCNLSEQEICPVCSDPMRDRTTVCIVESPRDVMSFERVGEYRGLYHVLHGLISPLDNIGPDAICIDELVRRLDEGEIKEAIMATGATTEGEATAIYISNKILKPRGIKVTRLSYGIPIGSNLEYADEMTLLRALKDRNEF